MDFIHYRCLCSRSLKDADLANLVWPDYADDTPIEDEM